MRPRASRSSSSGLHGDIVARRHDASSNQNRVDRLARCGACAHAWLCTPRRHRARLQRTQAARRRAADRPSSRVVAHLRGRRHAASTRFTPRRTGERPARGASRSIVQQAVIAIEDERFYRPQRRRPASDPPRGTDATPDAGDDRAGRVDDHAAVRQDGDPRRTTPRPSSARCEEAIASRSSSSATTQGADPRAVPEHRSTSGTAPTGCRPPRTEYFGRPVSDDHHRAGRAPRAA